MVGARRGYNLIEVMVASAVTLLLLTAMYQLFVQGGILLLQSSTRAELQSAGLVGLQELSSELRLSAFAYLTVNATGDPPALAFRCLDPHADDVVFNPQPFFVIYYRDASRRALVRKTWSGLPDDPVRFNPDPLATGARLTASQMIQICRNHNGTERPVASDVDSFTVTPPTYPTLTPLTSVTTALSLSRNVGATPYTATVSTAVWVRNKS